ncbi:ABC1 kinase family protein [Amycolatopsis suaedae]|uniref:AarF/ABC1/UbiB kinase family protein n=1 Tax=Amycolatopsis suaedae TaxID=2510978 RepID=A0A4Q7JE12_9PSEU|nr:AarF/UbiB family protein [Amycolatopsis suaedae]RZQ65709.1 AarF/ABC1/UbiB kinase family protein [Amycolatopsis suaedae]
MLSPLFALLSLPFYLVVLWPLVVAARRVLGVRIGVVRALVGAAIGWAVGVGAMTVLLSRMQNSPGAFAALIIPIAGSALLATMIFLFLAEMAVPSGTALGPIARLRSLRRRVARARRYSQISRIAVRHGLGPYLVGRRDPEISGRQATLARSLRKALEEGGVTFVKLGQLLSTRPDLLAPPFIEELSRLQDQVSRVPAERIEEVLRDELGAGSAELFAEFDPVPLAAASIAQVHRARLRSGEDVVVKVQRPDVRQVVERDLDIVGRVAASLNSRAAWARSLGVVELAEGFAVALVEELDFRVEARNIAAVTAAYPDGAVALPRVHQNLSTERVLVMDRLDGVPLGSARPEDGQREPLARSLLDCLLRQVMLHGVFHADPHPGNVLLLADGRLGLLDFGSVGRLDAGLRSGLNRLLLAIDRGDPGALRDGLLDVVDRPDEIDEQRLERALGALVAKHFSHGQAPDVELFTDLFRVIAEFRLAVPPPVAAVFRALATMEGTLAMLAPGFNIMVESRQFATARVGEKMRPDSAGQVARDELLAMLPVLRGLPRRIDRITGALEQGRLSVNVRLLADERDRGVVTGWLHEVLLAFAGATTGLMAALLLAGSGGPNVLPDLPLNHVFGYNLLVISALVGLRLLFVVFRGQRRQASRTVE